MSPPNAVTGEKIMRSNPASAHTITSTGGGGACGRERISRLTEAKISDSSPNEIVNVKVIRRALGGILKAGIVAHSALLVETKNGSKHIIEYLEDGKIHKTDEIAGRPLYDKSKWASQEIGATPSKSVTPDQLVQAMQANVYKNGKYDILSNNCHMSQEYGRRDVLGVHVDKPYEESLENISKTLSAAGFPG
jgi:hypothetical protein